MDGSLLYKFQPAILIAYDVSQHVANHRQIIVGRILIDDFKSLNSWIFSSQAVSNTYPPFMALFVYGTNLSTEISFLPSNSMMHHGPDGHTIYGHQLQIILLKAEP